MKRVVIISAVLLAIAAGCSSDQRISSVRNSALGPTTPSAGALLHSVVAGAAQHRFARAADRGDLLAYPSRAASRREVAYTWHRTDLSEAHALRAINGQLNVTTPSGEVLKYTYQRHVEHPSGDWTWVGRLHGQTGEEALITFGARAAFGSLGQAGRSPLRLTIRDGVSWLVETDDSAVAQMDSPATRPRRPDFLIPPDAAREAADGTPATAQVGTEAATPPVGAPVVDVVLGYTTGFAAGLGGDSQAVTRLNNLVDITNQAYVNSQVNAYVRLVRAVPVAYPDATANETALQELTGYRSGTGGGPIPVPPALQPLRDAREIYGADLVSLVRKFNDPENDGCGIAWLLGGGQSGIDNSDIPFGYSVVSDGTDPGTDGTTYFCRDETLAHELGHNMGSQHDRRTATVDGVLKFGVYPYSFGFKTDATFGNFYTIMAYGDRGQTRYRVFSTPRVNYCGGLVCGVENEADNARSLNQTIPIIAAFRASTVIAPPPPPPPASAVENDMDGDGKSDIFWRHLSTGSFAAWLMQGSGIRQVINVDAKAPSNYWIVGSGDFNGDRRADILWTSNSLDLWIWTSTGAGFSTQLAATYPTVWTPAGVGDVNGDGKGDILWRHLASGSFAYWLMDGSGVTAVVNVPAKAPSGYWIVAARDFNGDGKLDILWTSEGRDLWLWIGAGGYFDTVFVDTYPQGWMPLGAGDINGDGRADIFWRHQPSGSFAYWLMSGATATQAINVAAKAPSAYRLVSSGDYNGDGKADLLWTSAALDLWLWSGNGSTFDTVLVSNYPSEWSP